ncbi:MAG: hypothetical protein AB9891_06335 [Anaerolineaceae bacterium]
MLRTQRLARVMFVFLCGLFLLGSSPFQTTLPTRVTNASLTPVPLLTATATPVPLPNLSLEPGEFYFRSDGQQSFLLSRNLAGYETTHFYQQLDLTEPGGSKFVRLTLDDLGMGYSKTGEVDETWVKKWEDVFEKAASKGIYVLPVFGTWYDWNNGTGYSTWKSNPLNEINGGPVKKPQELLTSGSPTQKLWLRWMKTLVERWQEQKNIIAWEIFSEINMVPGSTESQAVDFTKSAAAIIRETDLRHRPVTASLADFGNWSQFYSDESIDFINIHPYPVSGKLDAAIVTGVRSMLSKYRKPVLIGESGLSFLTPDSKPETLTTADRADIGIKHAIWAAVVSGAMNGRALWWEDGVAIYFPQLNLPFIRKYANAEEPVVNFVAGVDFSGFKPLIAASSPGVWGAVVGSEKIALGWYRDASSEPPNWDQRPVIAGQNVTISVEGASTRWKVDFYDTVTGADIIGSATITKQGDKVTFILPDFKDDIAFKMTALASTASLSIKPTPASTTDSIAGKWTGTISNTAGTFSTQVNLEIQPNCKPGAVCGKFSAPILTCKGDLFLKNIDGATFVFIEQNVTDVASCTSGGYEYLQLQPDGGLSYQFAFSPGTPVSSSGLLKHP